MPDSDATPYVYIIYSPDNQALVDRLIADLRGISIRVAFFTQLSETVLESAGAVLVIDSSETGEASAIVEIREVARRYNRPVEIVSPMFIAASNAYAALIDQISSLYGLDRSEPIAAPEPEFGAANEDGISADLPTSAFGTANEDDIGADLDQSLPDWATSLSADSAAAPIPNPSPVMPPVIAPPSLQPPQPPMPSKPAAPMHAASPAPKPSTIAPAPIAAPGSSAGPSGGLSDQRGSGAVNRDVRPSREESRRRSVDAPVSERASKKSAPVDDFIQAESEASESPKAKETMPAVEDVYFTAFRPETVPVAQWLTLLVYAHADRARDLITADAEKFAEQMGGKPKAVQGKAAAQLERGTELRIVPTCDGVQFNPESISVKWIEDWHRAEFRFQAESTLSGTEDVARVAIYVGPLLVGQIKLALSFTPAQPVRTPNILNAITGRGQSKSLGKLKPTSAKMYEARQIFLSYSHADTNIVLACRDACKRLGFIPLIDIDTLRAGQHWNDELMNLIERADIFQLFWSERAAQSKYVQQEWEHALKLVTDKTKGPDFIRPTYWEKPAAPIPNALADIHFDYTPAVG